MTWLLRDNMRFLFHGKNDFAEVSKYSGRSKNNFVVNTIEIITYTKYKQNE